MSTFNVLVGSAKCKGIQILTIGDLNRSGFIGDTL